MTNKRIVHVIFDAIDELNYQLPEEQRLEKSIDTVLFGRAGRLDSLGLVNLIVEIEQKAEKEFGVTVTLADERAMSQKSSPFRTVANLANYISLLLEETSNE